jgi:hypothetical protein
MKHFIPFLYFLLFSLSCLAQHYHAKYTYLYKGDDSANKKLILTEKFDDKGNIVYSNKRYYWNDTGAFQFDITYHYENKYEDTFLIYTLNYSDDSNHKNDSVKIYYSYIFNDNHHLEKKNHIHN